jgi:uncharacterized protein
MFEKQSVISTDESDRQKRALQGLAIYFIVLVPLSMVFETLMILGHLSWFWALMWTPTVASVVARLVLREGFGDVSFRFGGSRGLKAILFALIFPIIIGLISYGIAWKTSVAHFNPQPLPLVARFIGESSSSLLVMLLNIGTAATIVTIFSIRTAAGEEIGWRGYMLTRLIDADVPCPILASGLIWGVWHVPLILGGVYLAGSQPIVAIFFWMITATAFSFVFARLRLETGSVWPAIVLHASWNSLIQVAFDPASTGSGVALWVGESGILVALTMVIAAIIVTHGSWAIRKFPESQ